MNGKVGQHTVPLHCGHGQAGLLHIIKHLAEDSEVEGRRTEAVNPSHRPAAHEQEECNGQSHDDPPPDSMCLLWPGNRFRLPVPSAKTKYDKEYQNQNAYRKECPSKRCPQCGNRQDSKYANHGPALDLGRVHKSGDYGQKKYSSTGDCNDPDKGHLRQSVQPCQIPQRTRQA